jgi:PAS domain S-box-containing protein
MTSVVKILLVEDNPGDADLIREMLTEAGAVSFSVESVQRLSEAMSRLQGNSYDLVLLDLGLPDSSGLNTFLRLKAAAGQVPMIILSGNTDQEASVTAVKEGAQDFLLKGQITASLIVRSIRYALERKRVEEALKKSEEFVKNILSSINEAFVVVDRDFRILSANKAYCEHAGKPLENVIGKHCYEILYHVARPCHELDRNCACKRTFDTGEPAVSVHTHTDKNGKQTYTEVKTFAMKDKPGPVTAIIEIINDITEKRSLENQLRQAQKMEAIGTFAGGIAHDFNNILTAIIGYGNVALMKMAEDDPQRMNVGHVLEAADRAAALTKSLLAFSRKQVLDRKQVDLNTVIKRVEKFLARIIGEDVAIHLSLDTSAFNILADAGQLEQVFMNLATNARDAMPHGGSFTIETAVTELDHDFVAAHGYGKPGTYAVIAVSDTGMGMDEATRMNIFEPFFTTKEVGKGTGLGLAMVYGIIKQHEGFINVYSEPGKGTTFRIYLPISTTAAWEETASREEKTSARGTETVLLAEDNDALRELYRIVLEEYGYSVIDAVDGEEAVRKFIANKDTIHMLLFDLIMPKMNGKEAYDEIRKIKPDIKVIFASGYAPDVIRQKSPLETGAHLVYKPISPRELMRKVRSVLDGAAR